MDSEAPTCRRFGIPSVSEVISVNEGRCPRCGKPLRIPDPSEVVVEVHHGE